MNVWFKRGFFAAVAFVFAVNAAFAADIGREKAERTAITRTGGGSALEVAYAEGERPHYSVLVVDGAQRFDVDVDAASGEVVKYTRRNIQSSRVAPLGMGGRDFRLSPVDAERSALSASGGGVLVRSDIAHKVGGGKMYDMEVIRGNAKYLMQIDANNGDVVSFEERRINGAAPLALSSR